MAIEKARKPMLTSSWLPTLMPTAWVWLLRTTGVNGSWSTATRLPALYYYLITRWRETGKLKGNEYVVKTIVTTNSSKPSPMPTG
jgi:hypothetical protein